MLDGCSINGKVWVFGASTTNQGYLITVTDTLTNSTRTYDNDPGLPAAAIADVAAFPQGCAADVTAATSPTAADGLSEDGGVSVLGAEPASHGCPGESALCLQDDRYEVTVKWFTADGREGMGRPVSVGTADSGLFWFFDPRNWEMLVKVLDGCAFNERHWVFAAFATDVGLELVVTDTVTGASRTYTKGVGNPAPAVTDVGAFPEGCRQ